eukprot:5054467-Pyramimonas_sp.AAC.1
MFHKIQVPAVPHVRWKKSRYFTAIGPVAESAAAAEMLLHVHARDSIILQMLEELKSILRGDDRQFGATVELLRNALIVPTKSLKL